LERSRSGLNGQSEEVGDVALAGSVLVLVVCDVCELRSQLNQFSRWEGLWTLRKCSAGSGRFVLFVGRVREELGFV
jgi:hypothetical protein